MEPTNTILPSSTATASAVVGSAPSMVRMGPPVMIRSAPGPAGDLLQAASANAETISRLVTRRDIMMGAPSIATLNLVMPEIVSQYVDGIQRQEVMREWPTLGAG